MKTKLNTHGAIAVIALTAVCGNANALGFGNAGVDGGNGANGPSGGNGQNAVVNVSDGHSQILDLRGQNGADGGSGGDGTSAWNCANQPRTATDTFGAKGGEGGSAGAGGYGGNGGNAVIYYTNPAQLKNILIDATGGKGGMAGYAGKGGDGCMCMVYFWDITSQQCTPAQPPSTTPVCRNESHRYFCHAGDDGRQGSQASNGSNGNTGTITLIQSATALTAPSPALAFAATNLPMQANLSFDTWATATGGLQLLAPGSIVQDTFRYYTGRHMVPVSVEWNARLNKSLFDGYSINVATDQAGKVTATTSRGLWASTSIHPSATGTVVSVDRAVIASQTIELSGSIQGSGDNTTAEINDHAQISDIVDTQISATVKSGGGFIGFIMVKRYDGGIPSNLIRKTAGHMSVLIGQLPGIDSSKLGDKKIKVNLYITRSLGGASQAATLDMQR